MPTYVYECKRCGHTFEAVQKMTDPPKRRCPECKGALQKVFHPVGIVFKGSGFHKTDYASKKSETKSETKSDTKADTKTETKTETKSESKKADTPKTSEPKKK